MGELEQRIDFGTITEIRRSTVTDYDGGGQPVRLAIVALENDPSNEAWVPVKEGQALSEGLGVKLTTTVEPIGKGFAGRMQITPYPQLELPLE